MRMYTIDFLSSVDERPFCCFFCTHPDLFAKWQTSLLSLARGECCGVFFVKLIVLIPVQNFA